MPVGLLSVGRGDSLRVARLCRAGWNVVRRRLGIPLNGGRAVRCYAGDRKTFAGLTTGKIA
jgi:hypothetical protein